MPPLVTVFLVVLGVAGLAVLLGGSVRRTGHDLAVLQHWGSLGCRSAWPRWSRAPPSPSSGRCSPCQLGIALGRWIWRLTIDEIGLVEHIVVPGTVLAGVGLLAVAVGLVVSSIQAARIARGSVGSDLRVE